MSISTASSVTIDRSERYPVLLLDDPPEKDTIVVYYLLRAATESISVDADKPGGSLKLLKEVLRCDCASSVRSVNTQNSTLSWYDSKNVCRILSISDQKLSVLTLGITYGDEK